MKKLEDPFSFPHYWFDVIFLFTYVPTNIVFDYFVQDWAYTGRIFCRTSMTAFLILEAVCFLQLYLFRYKLKGYLLPEHEELYAWLTRKKDNPLTILPFVLCKKTLKWEEPEDPRLQSVRRSVLQFGNSARIMLAIWLSVQPIMSLLGYSGEMWQAWAMRGWQ
ncbi:hypothetical protein [Anaerotruncus rubiinfantis]|uniref:hypothetical protein n=1 Tax=Anaerotruncus rubiinfantis TaxID=1720200 RepID=UPI0011C9AC2A|nr:hypothetical protein [Anaerotruncus rubiinfantis]